MQGISCNYALFRFIIYYSLI